MRMSGYPAKTDQPVVHPQRQMDGQQRRRRDGAVAVLRRRSRWARRRWNWRGVDGIICTQVACNPKDEIVAGGFADGLVVVADITSSRILPVVPPDHGPISTLAWSPDGTQLAVGTETGFAAIIDFAKH